MIFFDIDDTLFDNSGSEIRAAKRFYHENQVPDHFRNHDDFVSQWRQTTEKYLQMFIEKQISFQDQRRCRLRDIFRRPFSPQEADTLFEKYLQYYEESWELFADAPACLDRLTPLGLGIISNGNSEQQRQKLRQLGIIDRFETIVISEDIGIFKPGRAIFIHACETVGRNPADCFYVGDKPETDAAAASRAGLTGIWLNRGCRETPLTEMLTIGNLDALNGSYLREISKASSHRR